MTARMNARVTDCPVCRRPFDPLHLPIHPHTTPEWRTPMPKTNQLDRGADHNTPTGVDMTVYTDPDPFAGITVALAFHEEEEVAWAMYQLGQASRPGDLDPAILLDLELEAPYEIHLLVNVADLPGFESLTGWATALTETLWARGVCDVNSVEFEVA